MVNVATPLEPMVPDPRAVRDPQAEVEHELKETVPVGVEGSFAALAPVTSARSVTGCRDVGGLGEALRAVDVPSVNWALPVYEKLTVVP